MGEGPTWHFRSKVKKIMVSFWKGERESTRFHNFESFRKTIALEPRTRIVSGRGQSGAGRGRGGIPVG